MKFLIAVFLFIILCVLSVTLWAWPTLVADPIVGVSGVGVAVDSGVTEVNPYVETAAGDAYIYDVGRLDPGAHEMRIFYVGDDGRPSDTVIFNLKKKPPSPSSMRLSID